MRHSVGTHQGNELKHNSSGDAHQQSSQLAEPLWADPWPKRVKLLAEFHRKTNKYSGGKWLFKPSLLIPTYEENKFPTHTPWGSCTLKITLIATLWVNNAFKKKKKNETILIVQLCVTVCTLLMWSAQTPFHLSFGIIWEMSCKALSFGWADQAKKHVLQSFDGWLIPLAAIIGLAVS